MIVSTAKKITNIVSTVFLALFVLLIVLMLGVRIFGIEPHVVLSGSMKPEIMTGSMVYVKRLSPQEACELQVGDTVTYLVDKRGTKVTHKIYEVVGPLYAKNQYGVTVLDENGQPTVVKDDSGNPIIMYTTYGINNKNDKDPSGYDLDGQLGKGNLASSNVYGKPLFSIPLLGYVASFVQSTPGRYISIAICALLIFGTFLGSTSKKGRKE